MNIIITNIEEYNIFLNILEKEGYHWLSGQSASNAPTFLRPAWIFRKTDSITCIRSVDPDKKTIGFVPIEVYTEKEREQIIKSAIPLYAAETLLQEYF